MGQQLNLRNVLNVKSGKAKKNIEKNNTNTDEVPPQ